MKNKKIIRRYLIILVVVIMATFGMFMVGNTVVNAFHETQATSNSTSDSNPDIAKDSFGNLHIVYERDGNVYYNKKDLSTGIGTEETIGAGSGASISVDTSGNPHVAYVSSGNVIYANKAGDIWTPVIVAQGSSPDIDVDGSGKAHIVYLNNDSDYADIDYANNTAGTFVTTTIYESWYSYDGSGRTGRYYDCPHIKIDASGKYHIVASHYAVDGGSGWTDHNYYIVYTSNSGSGINTNSGSAGNNSLSLCKNPITVDASGNAYILYNWSDGKLYMASVSPWTATEVGLGYGANSVDISNVALCMLGVTYSNGDNVYYTHKPLAASSFATAEEVAEGANSALAMTNYANVVYVRNGEIYCSDDKPTDADMVTDAKSLLTFDAIKNSNSAEDNIISDLNLVSTIGSYGVSITWESNNNAVANDGTVTRPAWNASDATGTLIATLTKGTETDTVTFNPIVKKMPAVYVNAVSGSDTNDGLSESTAKATIQAGVDTAAAGDVVVVAAGIYNENVNINKFVKIIGSGSSIEGTIVKNAGSSAVITIGTSGISDENPLTLKDIKIEATHAYGINMGSVSYVKLDNVKVIGTNETNDTENEVGLKVATTANVSNLNINDCAFDHLTYGWYFAKEVSSETSNVSNVTVTNTSFSNNDAKGAYVEKLSDATFTDCIISNNGINTTYWNKKWNCGFDINLKAGTYQNITFNNTTVTNNGLNVQEGAGLAIKARDDGATYGASPATLTNVTIDGGTFNGNERGIRLGEPDKANVGPTNVIIRNANIYGNIKTYTGTDGTAYGDVVNQSLAGVNAGQNWWNTAVKGNIQPKISGTVTFEPYYVDAAKTILSNVASSNIYVNTLYTEGDANGHIFGYDAFSSIQQALKNTAENTVVSVYPGEYSVTADDTWNVQGQTGWYLPITQNGVTLQGVDASGNPINAKPGVDTTLPLIYGSDNVPNGSWASQDLTLILGNNVTITGLHFMPKVEPNKTIEVSGTNAIIKYCKFTPTSKVDTTDIDGYDYSNYGGSLYINEGLLTGANDITIQDNYFSKTCIAFDSADCSGTKIVKNNTFDGASYYRDVLSGAKTYVYMIGNVSWESPTETDFGKVTVQNNTFTNIEEIDNANHTYGIIKNRMNGEFELKDNIFACTNLSHFIIDTAKYGCQDGKITLTKDTNAITIDKAGAHGNTQQVYVDDDWSTKENYSQVDINGIEYYFGVNAFSSIQNAVDAATSGGTVNVAEGTYSGDIIINKPVNLLGPNAEILPNNLDGTLNSSRVDEAVINNGSMKFVVGAHDISIKGFKFTGDTEYGSITDGTMNTPYTSSYNITIENNYSADSNRPLVKFFDCDPVARNNWIIDNNRIQNVTNSIESGINLAKGSNITVTNNVIDTTQYGGILLSDIDTATVSNNRISNVQQQGIQVADASKDITVSDNIITNANISHTSDKGGIRVYGQNILGTINITNNTITGSFNGVAIKDGQNITGKEIHINNNKLTNNSNVAVYNGGIGMLDAARNWWGTASKNEIESNVRGTVTYYPWYLEASKSTLISSIADLLSIESTAGTYSPIFNKDTLSYTVSVQHNVENVTVTPSVVDENASIKVNGSTVTSGESSGQISLIEGNNNINIVVTSNDTSQTKTYVLTVYLDKTPPVVTGISDNAHYNTDKTITFNEGTATLNGALFTSGNTVSAEGNYILIVTDDAGNSTTVIFEIDKTLPVISGITDNTNYNANVTPTYNEGTATLNGAVFLSGTEISTEGSFTLVATDLAGNSATVNFKVDKTAPTAPTIEFIAPLGYVSNTWTNATQVRYKITVGADAVSGINKSQYSYDNIAWNDFDTTYKVISSEDIHYIYARSIDNAGNIGASATAVAKIDRTSPTAVDSGNPTDWVNTPTTITVNGSDTLSGVKRIQKPDSVWVESDNVDYSVDTIGTYTFVVEDNAGNTYNHNVSVTKVDTVVPIAPVITTSAQILNSDSIMITGTVEANAHIVISKAGTTEQFQGDADVFGDFNIEVSLTQDAVNTFSACARDIANNWSTESNSVTITEDSTSPIITIDSYITTPTNQDITVTATVDHGTLNAPSNKFTENGSFKFTAVDAAGNESNKTVSITNIDKIKPIITLTGDAEITVEAKISYEDAGVTANDNYDGDITSSVAITNLVDKDIVGDYTVKYDVTDKAGNIADTVTRTVHVVDTTPPSIPVITPSITQATNQNITVSIDYSADSIVKEYSFDNIKWTNYTEPFLVEENCVIYACAMDAAGNVSNSQITIDNIDKIVPIITITGITNGMNIFTSTATFTVSTNEASTVTVKVNNVDVTASESSYTASLNVGTNNIVVEAKDAANNTTTQTYNITYLVPSAPSSPGGSGSSTPAGPIAPPPAALEDNSNIVVTENNNSTLISSNNQVEANEDGSATITQTQAEQIIKDIEDIASERDALDEGNASESKITIEVPNTQGKTETNVNIPITIIEAASTNEIDKIEISTGVATIEIPTSILENTNATSLNVESKIVNSSTLTAEQKAAVGNSTVYDFTILAVSGETSSKISNFSSTVNVSIPYTLQEGQDPNCITVYFINDNGELENMQGAYINGKVTFTTNHFSKYFVTENRVIFDDISNYEWAKASIEGLAAKGIITDRYEGKFNPDNSITRAEFTEMIVNLLKLTDNNVEMTFMDVKPDDWYYNAIATAVKAGLVEGRSAYEFGPNDPITRQDITTLTIRAMKKFMGITDGKYINLKFKDKKQIARYARTSVATAVKYEIVKGYDDNTFRPLNNTTRACAAVLIQRVFELMQSK